MSDSQYIAERDQRLKEGRQLRVTGYWALLIGAVIAGAAAVIVNVFHISVDDPAYQWISIPGFVIALWGGLLVYFGACKSA